MSATNDTPLKRFTAFWVVLGAFLLFGIIALIIAPLANTSEVTAADEAGAERRLAIRQLVDTEQAKLLTRTENGDKLQVPPAEVFSLVGSKLASTKPAAMKDDKFRDPAAIKAEAEAAPAEEAATEETPAEKAPEAPAAEAVSPAVPATPVKPAEEPLIPASSELAPEPAATPNPALTPQAPRTETATEPADPSAL